MTSRLLTRKRATIADGEGSLALEALTSLQNRGFVNHTTPHTPAAATITAVIGVRLTARHSGLFLLAVHGLDAVAVATEAITWTVTSYTDAVAGTPLTLPAGALATGTNCFIDNPIGGGGGIAPSAGATGGTVISADTVTLGTLAVGDKYSWSGLVTANGAAVPKGSTFYATLSITGVVSTDDAVSSASIAAYELP